MKITGAILAGGKSSRMKFNKALAIISGKPVFKIILDKFQLYFDETITISNEPQIYSDFGTVIYPDIFPGLGPVAGIHSALFHARYDRVFVMGCDMPFMNMELVTFLSDHLEDYDCVVPVLDDKLQPLSALYSKSCLPILTSCLENDKLKLIRIFEELNHLVIPELQLAQFGEPQEIFLNVNDQAALVLAQQIAGRYL